MFALRYYNILATIALIIFYLAYAWENAMLFQKYCFMRVQIVASVFI